MIAATPTFSFPPLFFPESFGLPVDMPFLRPVVLLSNTNAADTNRHLSGSYTVRKEKSEHEAEAEELSQRFLLQLEGWRQMNTKKKKKNQASNQKAIIWRNHDWVTIQFEIGPRPLSEVNGSCLQNGLTAAEYHPGTKLTTDEQTYLCSPFLPFLTM